MSVVMVSATRHSQESFWSQTALGQSLARLGSERNLAARIAFSNRLGLSSVYNLGIAACGKGDTICFVHDDVWIADHYFPLRVLEGLAAYDIIGVAGNRRRRSMQPSWAFIDVSFRWDDREFLSGAIAGGRGPFGPVTVFGEAPAECELLDGVILCAKVDTLCRHKLSFDERYAFHFYDLDFCRSARSRGLRLGTWPLSISHQSGGGFQSPDWRAGFERYVAKWGD